uniref:Uncharacterized protein n=1 Tax=Alexandrium monilatum TaxID=311494 RepID=A0A7S4UQB3_9DINO
MMQALGVTRTLAVSSCKGGVGKSSVSLRLALALQRLGMRVGLLDADVHGPSLPALLPPLPSVELAKEKLVNGRLRPLQALGLECMSWGFLPRERTHYSGEATVLRGHWAARVAVQLALGTQWDAAGPLDVLVLDMPPGTGDVQLALLNSLSRSAAVVVSTPSPLALPDVTKGVEMLTQAGVPLVAVVENFAWQESSLSKEDVCAALQQWRKDLPPDASAAAERLLDALERLPLPAARIRSGAPFGESSLAELVELARACCPEAAGFQLPLTPEMAADGLAQRGGASEQVFEALALHVQGALTGLPPAAGQRAALATGDPRVVEFQSWRRFLHRIKHLHYA